MKVVSEGPVRITKATIEAVWRRKRPGRRLIIRDQDCRGLALIVNPTGMAWTYAYRPRGTDPLTGRRWANRSTTIGNPATHSPDDARLEANRIKGQAQAGADPVAERKARASKTQSDRGNILGTLAAVYERSMSRRQKLRGSGRPSPAYVAEEMAQLRLALAEMGVVDMPAAALSVGDIRRLLDLEGATNTRSRFGALSRFLDWCQDEGHIGSNPCALVPRARRPKALQPRAHYLAAAQLARLWKAAESLPEPVWRDFVRFLIAVPCRRGEAAGMEWSQVNLAAAEWHQPGQITKNGDPHRLHLHALALDVLRARHETTGGKGMVFPAPMSGKVLNTFTKLKADLGTEADLNGWTWHDFRRSFATALGEAGISEAVADAALNHRQAATRGGVLGVYQRASRWPEQVKAMEHWGRLLQAALDGGKVEAKVVTMTVRSI